MSEGLAWKVVDYTILSKPAVSLLRNMVKRMVSKDWQPTGGIETAVIEGELHFYQAMVKFEVSKEQPTTYQDKKERLQKDYDDAAAEIDRR